MTWEARQSAFEDPAMPFAAGHLERRRRRGGGRPDLQQVLVNNRAIIPTAVSSVVHPPTVVAHPVRTGPGRESRQRMGHFSGPLNEPQLRPERLERHLHHVFKPLKVRPRVAIVDPERESHGAGMATRDEENFAWRGGDEAGRAPAEEDLSPIGPTPGLVIGDLKEAVVHSDVRSKLSHAATVMHGRPAGGRQQATSDRDLRMLGHPSASMTLDVYAGLFGNDLDAVATRLDEAVAARDAD